MMYNENIIVANMSSTSQAEKLEQLISSCNTWLRAIQSHTVGDLQVNHQWANANLRGAQDDPTHIAFYTQRVTSLIEDGHRSMAYAVEYRGHIRDWLAWVQENGISAYVDQIEQKLATADQYIHQLTLSIQYRTRILGDIQSLVMHDHSNK